MQHIIEIKNHNSKFGSIGCFHCRNIEPDIIENTLTSAGFEIDRQQRTSHKGNLVTVLHLHKPNKKPNKQSNYRIDYSAFEEENSVWQALLGVEEIAAQVQERLYKEKSEVAFDEAIFRHWKATGEELTREEFLEMYRANGLEFDPIAYYDAIPSIAVANARALLERGLEIIDNIRAEGILNGKPVSPDELRRKLKNGDST